MRFPPKTLVLLAALALFLPAGSFCQSNSQAKGKSEKQNGGTRLRIEVTAGENNHPVESASVYVKFSQERALRKKKLVEMNLKTSRDGAVKVPEIPRGKVLVQVIAEGWKTFGRWYDLEAGEQTIKIHLEKPPRWY